MYGMKEEVRFTLKDTYVLFVCNFLAHTNETVFSNMQQGLEAKKEKKRTGGKGKSY